MVKFKKSDESNKLTKKQLLTQEAATLRDRFIELKAIVYFNGCIGSSKDYPKIRLLLENSYFIQSPDNKSSMELRELYELKQKLPKALHELRELKEDFLDLQSRIKARSLHFFKTGNFSEIISSIIKLQDIKDCIRDAKYFLDDLNTVPERLKGNGGYHWIKYEEIDNYLIDGGTKAKVYVDPDDPPSGILSLK